MTYCKGICTKQEGSTKKGSLFYKDGRRFCIHCACAFVWDGIHCPCCSTKLRGASRNRNSASKKAKAAARLAAMIPVGGKTAV